MVAGDGIRKISKQWGAASAGRRRSPGADNTVHRVLNTERLAANSLHMQPKARAGVGAGACKFPADAGGRMRLSLSPPASGAPIMALGTSRNKPAEERPWRGSHP